MDHSEVVQLAIWRRLIPRDGELDKIDQAARKARPNELAMQQVAARGFSLRAVVARRGGDADGFGHLQGIGVGEAGYRFEAQVAVKRARRGEVADVGVEVHPGNDVARVIVAGGRAGRHRPHRQQDSGRPQASISL